MPAITEAYDTGTYATGASSNAEYATDDGAIAGSTVQPYAGDPYAVGVTGEVRETFVPDDTATASAGTSSVWADGSSDTAATDDVTTPAIAGGYAIGESPRQIRVEDDYSPAITTTPNYSGDDDLVTGTTASGYTGTDTVAADLADPGASDNTNIDSDDPEVIRAEIEQTRNSMSATIDAIQERLNPENLLEQAKDTVREATVGRVEQMVNDASSAAKDTGTNLVDMVKQNPVPAALLGLGLAWFLTRDKGNNSNGGVSARQYEDWNRYSGPGYAGAPPYAARPYESAQYGATNTPRTYYTPQYRQYPPSGNSGQSNGGPVGQIVETIRQNPIPAALTGLGITWLLMNNGNGNSGNGSGMLREAQYRVGDVAGQAGDTVGQAADTVQRKASQVVDNAQGAAQQAQDTAGQVLSDVQDKAGQVAGQVSGTAGQVVSQVADTAGQVAGQVGNTAGQVAGQAQDYVTQFVDMVRRNPLPAAIGGLSIAWLLMNRDNNRSGDRLLRGAGDVVGGTLDTAQGTISDVAEGTQQKAQQAQTRLQQMLQDNPLGLAAVVAGVGIAVGLSVPETAREHELLGEARDNLLSKAQEAAQNTMEKVQRVAEEAGNTVTQEAQNQGLAPTESDYSSAQV